MRIIYDIQRDGVAAINTASDELAKLQQQISTGRRINAASDDPRAAESAVREHATLGAVDAYSRTRDSAASRLSMMDTVLGGIVDKVSASIVTGMSARGSAVSPAARAAAAEEIRGLRGSLVNDFNTQLNGVFLFSGSATHTPAYAQIAGVWTYQGDANPVQVEIESGRLVSVTADGQTIAQGSDTANVLTVLDDLATAIEAGDNDAIGAGLDALNRAFDRLGRAQGRLGADERGLDQAQVRLTTLRQAAETRRSSLEDTNIAAAVTRFSKTQDAYHAALGVVSATERLTLLDYLR